MEPAVSQDNRNKTMFGRSPFHVADDGAEVAAEQVRAPGGASAPSLGFDEDGWDIDEVAISGSRPAAVSGASPVAPAAPTAPAIAVAGSPPGGSFFGGGTMRIQRSDVDDAVSASSMRRPAPEPESEQPFTGTMRFRPEDLAGVTDRARAPVETAAAAQQAFTGTMRLSRHEMDAALIAVGVQAPPAASAAPEEARTFTGTMRFRAEDLGGLGEDVDSPTVENPMAGGQASVRPASDPPAEATVRAFTGTMRFRPEDIDDVVNARASRSAASKSTVEASPELAESLRVRTIPNLTPQSLPALDLDAEVASGAAPAAPETVRAAENAADAGDAAALPLSSIGGEAGAAGAEAPVPEPGRPVWGTIPIMIDDIPRLLQSKEGEAAPAEPEASAPPVAAAAAPVAEFGSTMVMGTQDVQDALAKASAGSTAAGVAAAAAAPAAGAVPQQPAAPAVTRAPLPPTVEGETAGLLRDLAPSTKPAAAPPAAPQQSGPPIVAIVGGAIVLGIIVLVLYMFVL
jgi:hypothetical protein